MPMTIGPTMTGFTMAIFTNLCILDAFDETIGLSVVIMG